MNGKAAAAAALATITATAALTGGSDRHAAEPPAVVRPPATAAPTARRSSAPKPSATGPARRALRWQLAAEHGDRKPLPEAVFTISLAAELKARPPRPAPHRTRARIGRIRELKSPGTRRAVATITRDGRTRHVNVELTCTDRCRVSAIQ